MSCIFLNAYKFYFHMWKCSSFSCSLFLHCRNVVPYPWTISLVWVKKTRGHLAQQWLSSHSATPSTLLSENILKYRKSPQSNAYFWDKGISAYLSLSVVIMKAHSTYNALFFFFPPIFCEFGEDPNPTGMTNFAHEVDSGAFFDIRRRKKLWILTQTLQTLTWVTWLLCIDICFSIRGFWNQKYAHFKLILSL